MISTHLCSHGCLVLEQLMVRFSLGQNACSSLFPFQQDSPWWLVKTEEVWMDLGMDSRHRQNLLFQLMSDGVVFGHILNLGVSSLCPSFPLLLYRHFKV